MKQPNVPQLLPDRSDERMPAACWAGFTVVDCLALGLSPIALTCNEGWKPLLECACEKFGYCWEWVPTETLTPEMKAWGDSYALAGEAVLTKVS